MSTESTSLYRRHRPGSFDEVVGQTHVVRTLRNAVEQDKVNHAYLFVGSRGTGKTSMAKILARLLNCERGGPTGETLTVDTGREKISGQFLDLAEDGALIMLDGSGRERRLTYGEVTIRRTGERG